MEVTAELCRIWGFHRGVTEDSGLLGCGPVSLRGWFQIFLGIVVPSSSESGCSTLKMMAL
jgi:hypothetical protein